MSARYPRRKATVAARRLGDELMIMSAVDSTLVTLNDVAAFIWDLADGSRSLDDIAATLCSEYDVAPEVAGADVVECAEQLLALGVVDVKDAPWG